MNKPTLTEIRKSIIANGGEYRKLRMTLNGQNAYEVNGVTMTKGWMIEAYMLGDL